MELLKLENENNVTFEFHEACNRGDIDKVVNLMKRKKEINVKELDKRYTLERAVRYEYPKIVELLLRVGVNVNQKEELMGIRPLHCACAGWGNLAIARILLDNGADINATDECYNQTALHFAVLNKRTSITKLLLENGCKTIVRNHKGLTALERALEKGFVGIVKLFAFHNK